MTTSVAPAPLRLAVSRERLLDLLSVGLPAALALALCLLELGARSLWLDEAATFSIASQHGAAFGSALAHDGGNMLGYYGLMHVLIAAFGHGPLVLRLPSAIAAAATVALTGTISLRLWDRAVALPAGILAAVSLTLVYWGQDARAYALMMALTAGSFLAFFTLLQADHLSRRTWLAYVVLTTGAVYAALAAALIVPAQLLVLLWRRSPATRRSAGAVLAAVAAVAACCAPLAVLAVQRGSSQLFWVPGPSARTAKQLAQALTSSGLQPGYYTATGDSLLILTGVVVLTGVVEAVRAVHVRRTGAWPVVMVVSWLIVPAVAALVVSAASHSIFQARYVLVSLPAVAILVAWTLRAPWLPGAAAVAVLAALVVLRALSLSASYGVSSEQWRAATSYVAAHARQGDCSAFYPLDTRMPFEYYAAPGRRLPRPVLPSLAWGQVRSYVEEYRTLSPGALTGVASSCSRVWLVWSHEGKLGGPAISGANFRRLRSLRAALAARYPSRATRSFGRASPISVELFTVAG